MTHAHFKAVQALLPSTVKSFLYEPELSVPPALSDFPYVLFWGDMGEEVSGEPGDRTASDSIDQLAMTIRCTLVATSGEGLGWLVQNTRPFLNRARPVVAGWKSSRLRQQPVMPADSDTRVSVGSLHPVYAVDEYSFVSSQVVAP